MSDNEGVGFEEAEGFTFDMSSQEEAAGFAPIPQGNYNATIEECEYKMSASSGQPMWALKWAVTDEPYASDNRKMFSFVSFKKEQLGRVKQWLNRVAPELANLPNFNPKTIADEGVLLGKPARLKVKITTYQGEKRNNVAEVLAPLGAGGFSQ